MTSILRAGRHALIAPLRADVRRLTVSVPLFDPTRMEASMIAEKVRLRLTGTRPQLMHSSRLADPLDPITKRLAKLNGNAAEYRSRP